MKGDAGISEVLVIHMTPREIECRMCGEIDNHDNPDDRREVPIWNGELTTSESEVDGYAAVCTSCYQRWDEWAERMNHLAVV